MAEDTKSFRPRCMFLTCKAMIVYGEEFESDPDYQAGAMDFTCNCTYQVNGPDGGPAGLEICSNPERNCFREF
jgi:hypothetical protein